MNDALQQLRDLHLPHTPHWWPPAPGWWLAALLVILATAVIFVHLRRKAARRLPFKLARSELSILVGEHTDDGAFADRANALIKRALIHGLHRSEAAAQSGTGWLRYLDTYMDRPCFTAGPGAVLGDARFAPGIEVDRSALCRDIESLLARLERHA